jgi:hypothetical protein
MIECVRRLSMRADQQRVGQDEHRPNAKGGAAAKLARETGREIFAGV